MAGPTDKPDQPSPKPGDALRALPAPPDLPEDLTLFSDDELEHLLNLAPALVALCTLAGNTTTAVKISQQMAALSAEAQRRVADASARNANAPPAPVGDLNSDAKGSGARFNAGKPDFALLPLLVVYENLAARAPVVTDNCTVYALNALYHLGQFQATSNIAHLKNVLKALDPEAVEAWAECARVFSYGKEKYAPWNWAKGMPWSVPLACAARHLRAMIEGEVVDAESGLPHRGHVYCNICMLLVYADTFKEGNDLPAPGLLALVEGAAP